MDFHAEFFPKSFVHKINHRHNLLLVGSCFTEQMGNKLMTHKFRVLENPNGILFNPVSIAQAVTSYATGKKYEETDLFYFNELWGSWQHHTKFSNISKIKALEVINTSQEAAIGFIKKADWILITLGSAFVYEQHTGESREVVANCHKVPTDKFYRRLLEPQEIKNELLNMMETVRAVNAGVKFIFTISPVRHLREGFIENNRSKAALIQAVHSITDKEQVFYFPAYELVIDDLRDYRFYAEDMVHPNYAATNYVWEKFVEACIDEPSVQLMKEIAVVVAARNHRPFNPESEQHKKFLHTNLQKLRHIKNANPYVNFDEEESYFLREV
ncbi:MAG: GSCFA domain-containing protein [Bacteroidetes bacterium]|nr:GSCFA domain-containing protein [Bacteroidota bacterium]